MRDKGTGEDIRCGREGFEKETVLPKQHPSEGMTDTFPPMQHTAAGVVTFRPMGYADAGAAAALEAACSREAWSQKAYADALANENACYLVAECGGCIIGCCGLWQSFSEGDICNVAVDAGYRRQKIAWNMLKALMEAGAGRGITCFTLEVRKSNTAAVCLYEKLGFVTEGVRKRFYQNPPEDALIMWKR